MSVPGVTFSGLKRCAHLFINPSCAIRISFSLSPHRFFKTRLSPEDTAVEIDGQNSLWGCPQKTCLIDVTVSACIPAGGFNRQLGEILKLNERFFLGGTAYISAGGKGLSRYMAKWKMLDRDRMDGLRGSDHDSFGEFDQDGNPGCSPTTPLAFNGSPVRRSRDSIYVRSQSLNGRIQKPSVARSQSFNGKCAKLPHRNYHMDTLQAQLLYMKANGVDQKKFVNVLDKLKDMYLSRDQHQQQEDRRTTRQSLPSSPLSNNQIPSHSAPLSSYQMPPSSALSNYQMPPSSPSPLSSSQIPSSPLSNHLLPSSPLSSSQTLPPRVEDLPAEASTIALLKNKFAQLERYKESIQGQQIHVYPNQTFHSGHSSAQRTPVSSTPCSPRVGLEDSYYFDENTAALLALQQEMMSNSSRSAAAAASGISEDGLTSEHSRGSWSPGWSASACDSPISGSTSPQSDEAANALLHYMLQPNMSQHPPHSNLKAFQNMSLSAGANSNLHAFQNMSLGNDNTSSSGGMTDSLGGLLAAERMEIMMAKKTNTKLASSIQQVVAKFPFNFGAKFSSPKSKLPGASWGKSLSLHTPPPPAPPAVVVSSEDDYSGDRSWGSESPSPQLNGPDHPWYINNIGRECSNDIYMKQQEEPIDTSLHL